MFGHRGACGRFDDVFQSKLQVRMCGGGEVLELEVVEDPDRSNWLNDVPYWGWENASRPGDFQMVWHHIALLKICFPYGLEAAEERGRGRRVHLLIAEAPA